MQKEYLGLQLFSTNWSQGIKQGNTYTLSFEPEVHTISATSSAPIHSLVLVFNDVHLGGETDNSFQPLPATVNVLADVEDYRQFEYEALPPGKVSLPLGEEIYLSIIIEGIPNRIIN